MDKNKNIDLDSPMPDIVITEPIASLRAKLRLAVELDPLAEAHQAEGPLEPQEKIW